MLIVKDLDGNIHNWNLWKYRQQRINSSSLHIVAREILKEVFPLDEILEEVAIPGERLFLDFYLPLRQFAVEVNGEQHYQYNSQFYKNKSAFIKAQSNDFRKQHWCTINNINLVVLKYDESREVWFDRISREKNQSLSSDN